MVKKKYKYSIEIEIICDTASGFISSLEEVTSAIKKGNVYGLDSNDNEKYDFHVKREEIK